LYGGLAVTPGFLAGAGRARAVGVAFAAVAVANLVLSLALTPELGLEGPALGTAIPFALAFPLLVRIGLRASGASLAELALRAWLPAYALGAALAGAFVALRLAAEPSSLPAVVGAGAGGILAYWLAFYGLWLDSGERALLRGLFRRPR
jgi:O-antigen/teichoic acid export membrane protein